MNLRKEINKLTEAEKILLIQEIWDDIGNAKKGLLTESQKKEIRRRVKLEEEGKLKIYTLEEAQARIKALKENV